VDCAIKLSTEIINSELNKLGHIVIGLSLPDKLE
jgi:hypothetical protein